MNYTNVIPVLNSWTVVRHSCLTTQKRKDPGELAGSRGVAEPDESRTTSRTLPRNIAAVVKTSTEAKTTAGNGTFVPSHNATAYALTKLASNSANATSNKHGPPTRSSRGRQQSRTSTQTQTGTPAHWKRKAPSTSYGLVNYSKSGGHRIQPSG